jgi:hypothetical protein
MVDFTDKTDGGKGCIDCNIKAGGGVHAGGCEDCTHKDDTINKVMRDLAGDTQECVESKSKPYDARRVMGEWGYKPIQL